MGKITVRRAEREDCPRMMELIRELADYERGLHEVTVTLEEFEEAGFDLQPVWRAFVAETEGGQIVGLALYYIRYSTWKGRRMYLEDIVVTGDMRGQGIGKLLFERLIEEARERGLHGMVWQALGWNEPAHNFYRKYEAMFDPDWINCELRF